MDTANINGAIPAIDGNKSAPMDNSSPSKANYRNVMRNQIKNIVDPLDPNLPNEIKAKLAFEAAMEMFDKDIMELT